MKKYTFRRFLLPFLAFCLLISLTGCKKGQEVDPHADMVSVADGRGGQMWVPRHDDVAKARYKAEDFMVNEGVVSYVGAEYEARAGIDVSEHQQLIDWAVVKADGVDFAIIRAGYRGYSEGGLSEDAFFRQNIEGAAAAGMDVGIYFFSQAISAEEAREEARYLLGLLEGYSVDLPVYFDWEYVSNVGETRAQELDGTTLTDCALAFCKVIEDAGFDSGVYFYRSLAYYEYQLERLSHLRFWVGAVSEYPDFYYRHDLWQYSYTGTVEGIAGAVDLNLMFVEKAAPTTEGAVPEGSGAIA